MQGRGAPEQIAHFVNQLVFCFFAHSVKLLPNGFFPRLLKRASENPENAKRYFDSLFAAMETGGDFDLTKIAHFNGGLFDGRRALPLDGGDVGLLIAAASLDWSLIDPSIFGTLFERFLDPGKRGQIGAHYTDAEKIMMIVNPVIVRPLREEWQAAKAKIEKLVEEAHLKSGQAYRNAIAKAEEARSQFLERLRAVTILDPACGSGNFLYLALQAIKDIELKANLECEAMGLEPRVSVVGPEIVRGIEINPLAAELARTTIWIGDIQWSLRNGILGRGEPILRKLESIECRDALLTRIGDGPVEEAPWPPAEFIVGNPPFLGIRMMRSGLGDETVEQLFHVYEGRVSREADLVVYWFEKARAALQGGAAKRVGLVATNSIRGGANRRVLDQIVAESRIFEAWSDEAWVIDGAAVRVSLVCFSEDHDPAWLDGNPVAGINADLTSGTADVTRVHGLKQNLNTAYMGDTKGGAFDVPGELARSWLQAPANPNGRRNADVLKPWRNGMDITRRSRDMWIIDFGWQMGEREAALFQGPFAHVFANVKPTRITNRRASYARNWWRHVEPRPAMWAAIGKIERYIATPTVARHRIFVWIDSRICPDHQLIAVTRDDDTTFGILHSRFHESWSLRCGTWLGVGNDPRYTPTTTFETFPFPEGLSPDIPAKDYAGDERAKYIAQAAEKLDRLRNAWLNPPDLVSVEPEVVDGYPERLVPKDVQGAATLRQRTLTNLYNERPQWLVDLHYELDAAVAAAYGWASDISEDDAVMRLIDLNASRKSVIRNSPEGDAPNQSGEEGEDN